MNYSKTTKSKLVEMLKSKESECVELAAKLREAERGGYMAGFNIGDRVEKNNGTDVSKRGVVVRVSFEDLYNVMVNWDDGCSSWCDESMLERYCAQCAAKDAEIERLKKQIEMHKQPRVDGEIYIGDIVELKSGARQFSGYWGTVVSNCRDGEVFVCVAKREGGSQTSWYKNDDVKVMRYFGANESHHRNIKELENKIENIQCDAEESLAELEKEKVRADVLSKGYDDLQAELSAANDRVESYQDENAALARVILRLNKLYFGEVV